MNSDPSMNDDTFIDAVASTLKTFPERPARAIEAIQDAVRSTPVAGSADPTQSSGGRGRVWAVGMTVIAAAASLVLMLRLPAPAPVPVVESNRGPEPTQFVYVDSGASGVSVVGSFNGWDPEAMPLRRDPTGIWSTETPLPPGRHLFAYVVDGEWRVDERAPKAPDNEFGFPSSVVVVSPSALGAL